MNRECCCNKKRKAALYLEIAPHFRMLRTTRSPRRGEISITPDKGTKRPQSGERDSLACKPAARAADTEERGGHCRGKEEVMTPLLVRITCERCANCVRKMCEFTCDLHTNYARIFILYTRLSVVCKFYARIHTQIYMRIYVRIYVRNRFTT